MQLISVSGKLTKVVLDELCHLSAAQVTLPAPFVQIRLQFSAPLAVVFNLETVLPLGAKRFRKTVGETKRYELSEPRLVAMRQLTALVPTAKTLVNVFQFRR